MQFVDVYSKRTGRKQAIPAHWLDIPSLMDPFRKTPKQRRTDRDSNPDTDVSPETPGSPASAPAETTTDAPHDGENDKE